MGNKNLRKARKEKKDEFYTQITDIEKELKHYKDQLKGKIIFCNCDDPEYSNFWKYFELNFHHLGLKKLVATHYDEEKPTYKLEYDGQQIIKTNLKQNGDFRSPEAVEILKQSDVVITNPPFSLFREYIVQLLEYDKKFLIIGNINAITYKEVFPLIKENRIWIGTTFNKTLEFQVPDSYPLTGTQTRIDKDGNKFVKVSGITWFTNLDVKKRHEKLILYKKYTPEEYPKYDNYDAINVNRVTEIPLGYDGAMGVPITFLDKYNPEQFEILDANDYRKNDDVPIKPHGLIKDKEASINGNRTYVRILIRRKR